MFNMSGVGLCRKGELEPCTEGGVGAMTLYRDLTVQGPPLDRLTHTHTHTQLKTLPSQLRWWVVTMGEILFQFQHNTLDQDQSTIGQKGIKVSDMLKPC